MYITHNKEKGEGTKHIIASTQKNTGKRIQPDQRHTRRKIQRRADTKQRSLHPKNPGNTAERKSVNDSRTFSAERISVQRHSNDGNQSLHYLQACRP